MDPTVLDHMVLDHAVFHALCDGHVDGSPRAILGDSGGQRGQGVEDLQQGSEQDDHADRYQWAEGKGPEEGNKDDCGMLIRRHVDDFFW